ncbi:MAG: cell division protein ZapA [Gammaproteobacteria bacterium]|tara:strand:+ start:202 stop:573 length:372 start_codon:yes stop_codon:yes gene_type:complete
MSEDESKDIISLKIAGIDYQLYCPEDEQETLLVAAEYLNKKIKKLKRQTKFLSVEKVAILAGLEITNEMMSSSQASNQVLKNDSEKVDENIIEPSIESDDSKKALEDSLSLKLVDEISELSKL